ncbi:MAG: phosphoribosylanthranilate isomerase [Lachnospiraceae bacterium]|nr:phosphoribosylanthranilate isomerase [Lachnospiraceae bacterium]
MLVKICGLTSEYEAKTVCDAGADFAGVVMFFEKSKRNVTPDKAKEIISALDTNVKSVAVMVSPTAEHIKTAKDIGFDYVQIHGELTEEIIKSTDLPIIKAFNVTDLDKYDYFSSFDKIIGFVMDANEYGSGKTFDWNVIKGFDRRGKLFILAGGLNPENVAHAIECVKPDGVDVSSGVEYEDKPGKDPEKIYSFVKNSKI